MSFIQKNKIKLLLFFSIGVLLSCGNISFDDQGNKKYEFFYPDGTTEKIKTQTTDSIGKQIDYWTFYYLNGNIQKEGPSSGLNNASNGEWKFYFESGGLQSKTIFKDDLRDGPCEYYWENGNIKGIGNYENGKLHGLWQGFHKNGEKEREGNLINGKENGTWLVWNSAGDSLMSYQYDMGTLLNQ